jgi:hypothetical protein
LEGLTRIQCAIRASDALVDALAIPGRAPEEDIGNRDKCLILWGLLVAKQKAHEEFVATREEFLEGTDRS